MCSSRLIPKPPLPGPSPRFTGHTFETGDRVVVKIQRPTARVEIEQDLALLEVFAQKVGKRPALNRGEYGGRVQTLPRRFSANRLPSGNREHRTDADGARDYDRLAVPSVYRELSTGRLLVMEEIQGLRLLRH